MGDVIGDLNSRRGGPLGMEPVGAGMTEIKAEVPMAEMLSYAPDLRSITGGQGEFTMEFVRYEEVPAHLAAKVVPTRRPARRARRRSRAYVPAGSAGTLGREYQGNPHLDTAVTICDVCGRTLLRGEHAEIYLGRGCPAHGLRAVHVPRAARGMDPRGDRARVTTRRPRGPTAAARCSGRREDPPRARVTPGRAGDEPAARSGRSSSPTARRRRAGCRPPRPRARGPAAGPGRAHRAPPRSRRRRPSAARHVRAVPTSDEQKITTAVDALQRLRAPAHGRGRRPLARACPAASVLPVTELAQRRQHRGLVGAVLVPLRGRPLRRGPQVRRPDRATSCPSSSPRSAGQRRRRRGTAGLA